MTGDTVRRVERGFGFWASMVLAVVLVVIGLLLLAGGIWLITLGGSWYYAIAGIGVTASGVLLFMGRRLAVLVYAVTWLFTFVWALWEAGLDGWAQVPRLVGPTVLLVLVLLTIPVLRRRDPQPLRWRGTATAAASLAILAVGIMTLLPTLAQHMQVVPLILFSTAVPLPFGALGLSEGVSDLLMRSVDHPSGAVGMMAYRVLMYLGGAVSVVVYLANLPQVRSLRGDPPEVSAQPTRAAP